MTDIVKISGIYGYLWNHIVHIILFPTCQVRLLDFMSAGPEQQPLQFLAGPQQRISEGIPDRTLESMSE
jgi:hypothetical protein